MAVTQLGNHVGVAARTPATQVLAAISGNGGANAFGTAANGWQKLQVDQAVDCYAANGTLRFSGRTIVSIFGALNVVAYSGADVPAITAGDLIFSAGARTNLAPSNVNGGVSSGRGLVLRRATTLEDMKARLQVLNPSYYTDTFMNGLTHNDLLYALRLAEEPSSI